MTKDMDLINKMLGPPDFEIFLAVDMKKDRGYKPEMMPRGQLWSDKNGGYYGLLRDILGAEKAVHIKPYRPAPTGDE